MQKSIMTGFPKALYARTFFPDRVGGFDKDGREMVNEQLGLLREELDETQRGRWRWSGVDGVRTRDCSHWDVLGYALSKYSAFVWKKRLVARNSEH